MSTSKVVYRIAGAVMLAGALASALVWNERRALRYNEEGHFFDAGQAVVYHQQAVAIYGAVAIMLGLAGLAAWVIAARR